MNFEFDPEEITEETVVAEAYYMAGSNTEKVICMKTTDPNLFVWLYEDGTIDIQSTPFQKDPIKQFRRGDKITIQF